MVRRQRHRGPDDEGYCLINTRTSIARPCSGADTVPELRLPPLESVQAAGFDLVLGHRRLSILDLSPAGHQPMVSSDGGCWIVFNGEIYNYLELRIELQRLGHRFTTQTDTEVLLAAYQEWGSDCLRQLNGMWAFALWDRRSRRLFCARDRFGIKPFFYAVHGSRLLFASEIKAILADSELHRSPNGQVVLDYLADGMVDHRQETFFEGILQLQPAHYLLIDIEQARRNGCPTIQPVRYWDVPQMKQSTTAKDEESAGRLRSLIEDSVRLQLRSDVPVGACLSGGLDSSTIVCLISRMLQEDGLTCQPVGEHVITFSSCFDDERFDERRFIQHVLDATGAESCFVFPQGERLLDDLPQLMWHQDEPFSGTSIFAQWSVFRRVRERGVKVVLDGQGADELLAGYLHHYAPYHLELLRLWQFRRFWHEWRNYLDRQNIGVQAGLRALVGQGTTLCIPRTKAIARQLLRRSPQQRFRWVRPEFRQRYANSEHGDCERRPDLFPQSLHRGLTKGLLSLLRYEDRNSMAFSVESRVPFLDHRLVEFVYALPHEQKIRGGVSKFVLRQGLKGILPEEIRNRADKMGFVTPEVHWINKHLTRPVRDVLETDRGGIGRFIDRGVIEQYVEGAATGRLVYPDTNTLWRVFNLAVWAETFAA